MTATQAARNFAGMLNAAEHGEVVIITRDGVPVGRFTPERRTTADRLNDAMRDRPADPGFQVSRLQWFDRCLRRAGEDGLTQARSASAGMTAHALSVPGPD